MRCVCFAMLLLCSFIANAGLVADYLFNHSLDTDFPQAASLQYVGGTPVYTQVQITGQQQTVLEVELLSGLEFLPSTLPLADQYSIVLYMRADFVSSYAKVIDFNALQLDSGLYSYNGVEPRFFDPNAVPAVSINLVDDFRQWVLTRDSSGDLRLYVDGMLQWSIMDSNSRAVFSPPQSTWFFIDDSVSVTENLSADIARLAIFDHVLSEQEIAALRVDDVLISDSFGTQ